MGQQDSSPSVQVSHVYLGYDNGRDRAATIVEDASFSIRQGEKLRASLNLVRARYLYRIDL
jgi:hypothetical protein